jgi:hypothetical protein
VSARYLKISDEADEVYEPSEAAGSSTSLREMAVPPITGHVAQRLAISDRHNELRQTTNTTPPMATLWKCATRNTLLCNWKSTDGTVNAYELNRYWSVTRCHA